MWQGLVRGGRGGGGGSDLGGWRSSLGLRVLGRVEGFPVVLLVGVGECGGAWRGSPWWCRTLETTSKRPVTGTQVEGGCTGKRCR
jgi:hypothetical protein